MARDTKKIHKTSDGSSYKWKKVKSAQGGSATYTRDFSFKKNEKKAAAAAATKKASTTKRTSTTKKSSATKTTSAVVTSNKTKKVTSSNNKVTSSNNNGGQKVTTAAVTTAPKPTSTSRPEGTDYMPPTQLGAIQAIYNSDVGTFNSKTDSRITEGRTSGELKAPNYSQTTPRKGRFTKTPDENGRFSNLKIDLSSPEAKVKKKRFPSDSGNRASPTPSFGKLNLMDVGTTVRVAGVTLGTSEAGKSAVAAENKQKTSENQSKSRQRRLLKKIKDIRRNNASRKFGP